jgi:hypothetical protein
MLNWTWLYILGFSYEIEINPLKTNLNDSSPGIKKFVNLFNLYNKPRIF